MADMLIVPRTVTTQYSSGSQASMPLPDVQR